MNTVTTDFKGEIINSFDSTRFGEANDSRRRAIINLEKLGLPGSKHEEYRSTPITKSLEKHFTWENRVSPSSVNSLDPFLIPNLNANILVFVNGSYRKEFSKIISSEAEVKVKTLSDAFQSEKGIIDSYFDKLVNSETDPFAAINTAFWQEGILIHVPANTKVEKPFLILHLNDSTDLQVIAHTRLLLVVEKNSELTLIEKFDSAGAKPIFHTFTEEIALQDNAQLEYYKIQHDHGDSYQIANTMIHQSDSSKLNTFTFTLDGHLIRNNFNITIDGEYCESHFFGLYLLNGDTLADNHTVVDHKKPNSFSNELYKGIMDGNSKGVFNGKIFVRPNAQKTNAFQANKNILLTDKATVNTKPQLEIWADDVKCSHGCTSGQLDEEAMFYLQSRGISKEIARGMMLYAFAEELLNTVKHPIIKNYLDQVISERLHKKF